MFPFIVGSPRSGTSLLLVMMDSHPDLAIPPESFFVTDLYPEPGEPFSVQTLYERLMQHRRFRLWGLPEEAVHRSLLDHRITTYPEAMRAVFGLYARHHGKAHFADKTPQYVERLDDLANLFPEARFIHLIRDGRNVALSWFAARFGPWNVFQAAREWKHFVEAGHTSGQRLGPDRYLEIRYEDLVDDPEQQLRKICLFIDLPFDPRMLDYRASVDRFVRASSRPTAHGSLRLPLTKNLRDWRKQMSKRQLAIFETIAGSTLLEVGFMLGSPLPRSMQLAITAGAAAYYSLRSLAGRLKKKLISGPRRSSS